MRSKEGNVVKHIYISPHSDDVALSCGGRIIANPARGTDTLVLNIFSSENRNASKDASPLENTFHDSINAIRTSEDHSAWKFAGVQTHYADIPESLLRNKFPFSIFARSPDIDVENEIYNIVISFVRSYPDATFYFPAGFGNHVDHLACTDVAFRLLDEGALPKILLYEDIPYCWLRFIRNQCYKNLLYKVNIKNIGISKIFRQDGAGVMDYLFQNVTPFPRGKRLFPIIGASLLVRRILGRKNNTDKLYCGYVNHNQLDDESIENKKNLILHYDSQLSMLFGNDFEKFISKYSECFAAETTIEIKNTLQSK